MMRIGRETRIEARTDSGTSCVVRVGSSRLLCLWQ